MTHRKLLNNTNNSLIEQKFKYHLCRTYFCPQQAKRMSCWKYTKIALRINNMTRINEQRIIDGR